MGMVCTHIPLSLHHFTHSFVHLYSFHLLTFIHLYLCSPCLGLSSLKKQILGETRTWVQVVH